MILEEVQMNMSYCLPRWFARFILLICSTVICGPMCAQVLYEDTESKSSIGYGQAVAGDTACGLAARIDKVELTGETGGLGLQVFVTVGGRKLWNSPLNLRLLLRARSQDGNFRSYSIDRFSNISSEDIDFKIDVSPEVVRDKLGIPKTTTLLELEAQVKGTCVGTVRVEEYEPPPLAPPEPQ